MLFVYYIHLKNNEGIEWPTKSSRSFEVSQSGTKSIWKKCHLGKRHCLLQSFSNIFKQAQSCHYHFMSFFGGWIIFSNLGYRSNAYLSIIYCTIFVDFYSTKYATHIYVPSFKKDQGMWVIEYWLKIDLEVKLFKNPNKK